jgi:transcription elongation factor Elf1
MDYVGMDYSVDLECSRCAATTRVRYSRLLALLSVGGTVACAACGRATNHNWTTVSKAQQLFREHFDRTRLRLEARVGSSTRSFVR